MKKESSITVLEKPVDKNDDDALLESLGYKQEFKREFTPWELFGVLFSVLGPVPSFASVLVYAIPNGGPVAMVWGWAICAFFLVIIALAMADLASAAPTSGGLYYWTYSLSSPRWRYLLCWIVGYANTMALTGSVASVGWGCAVQIMAAVSIGYDETFIPTNGQTYGVYCAILVVSGILCSTATKYIARVQSLYIVLNISCFIAIIIALPVATPEEFQNPASFALGNFQNLSTWHPGFAFVLSFIAPLWAVGAFDSPVHISEEASNASTAVPWAIILGASIPAILGWALNVVVAFCMGTDLESILGSGVGQPLAVVRTTTHPLVPETSHRWLDILMPDLPEQSRQKRRSRSMVCRDHLAVYDGHEHPHSRLPPEFRLLARRRTPFFPIPVSHPPFYADTSQLRLVRRLSRRAPVPALLRGRGGRRRGVHAKCGGIVRGVLYSYHCSLRVRERLQAGAVLARAVGVPGGRDRRRLDDILHHSFHVPHQPGPGSARRKLHPRNARCPYPRRAGILLCPCLRR